MKRKKFTFLPLLLALSLCLPGYAAALEEGREVEISFGETQISEGQGDSSGEGAITPITPEWTGQEQDVSAPRPDRFGQDDAQGPEGYDFRYTGWGEDSEYGASHYTTPAGATEEGETNAAEAAGKEEADILQFLLSDTENPEAPSHSVYCVDLDTKAREGWWYKLENLEDADYYPDEDAEAHIRAIVQNGYWGTEGEATGSLGNFQSMLQRAQQSGDADVQAQLAKLDFSQMTEGEAMAATQMAIWQYGNRAEAGTELHLEANNYDGASWSVEEGDEEAWARINAAAAYLASLRSEKDESTRIIAQDSFLESLELMVGERIDNGGRNDGNDSYHAALQFVLVVTPGENDRLCMEVYQDGSLVATEEILPGQTQYRVENLQLEENKDVRFNLSLQGVQYLEQGVYVYSSELRDGAASQSFVGIAEGYRNVDMDMETTLRFNVREAERQDTYVVPETPVSGGGVPQPHLPLYVLPESSPLLPPIPAAEVPNTGAASLLPAMMLLAGAAFLGLNALLRRQVQP